MAVKVGINASAASDATSCARLVSRARTSSRRRQRHHNSGDTRSSAQVRTILGPSPNRVGGRDILTVDGRKIKCSPSANPASSRGATWAFDIVVESTGLFTDAEKAKAHIRRRRAQGHHLRAAKNEDLTVVIGVNEKSYDPAKHNILSNASCTTNCLAPWPRSSTIPSASRPF